jgi:hypothetical protein
MRHTSSSQLQKSLFRQATWGSPVDPPTALVSRLGNATEMLVLRTRPGFEELVLYHDKSEMLVVADLFFNMTRASGLLGLLLKLNGVWNRPGQGHLQKFLNRRQKEQIRGFYRWH